MAAACLPPLNWSVVSTPNPVLSSVLRLPGSRASSRHGLQAISQTGAHPQISSRRKDPVEYDWPPGWLGKLLAGAYTRRGLQCLFAGRHKITGEQLAARAQKGSF